MDLTPIQRESADECVWASELFGLPVSQSVCSSQSLVILPLHTSRNPMCCSLRGARPRIIYIVASLSIVRPSSALLLAAAKFNDENTCEI